MTNDVKIKQDYTNLVLQTPTRMLHLEFDDDSSYVYMQRYATISSHVIVQNVR